MAKVRKQSQAEVITDLQHRVAALEATLAWVALAWAHRDFAASGQPGNRWGISATIRNKGKGRR